MENMPVGTFVVQVTSTSNTLDMWGWGGRGFNATFNNISVISWWSVLLMEETGENHRPVQITDKLYLS
jgi:hypothetical protein